MALARTTGCQIASEQGAQAFSPNGFDDFRLRSKAHGQGTRTVMCQESVPRRAKALFFKGVSNMLVLTRKQNEKIQIGDNVFLTVLRIKGNTVRLGIEAPKDVRVVRGELPPQDA